MSSYVEVINEASRLFHVHARDIRGKARFDFLIPARYAVYTSLLARGNSYSAIGRWLERDHTTIMYGVRRAAEIMERDPEYREKIEALIEFRLPAVNLGEAA